MENTSLSSDVWNNVTTSSSKDDVLTLYVANIRDLALKVVYIIIGTFGVLDNLFVIIIFALFIKITKKSVNILIVNQSVIDMCASFFTLLTAVVEVDGTRMSPHSVYEQNKDGKNKSGMIDRTSRHSVYDQFVCRVWLGRQPLFYFLAMSTYSILLTAFERYLAVIYPIWYKTNLKAKNRILYGAMVASWILLPAYVASMGSLGTDIFYGICIPWGAFRSYALIKANIALSFSISYLLPLTLMVFFYARIIRALRQKVAATASSGVGASGRNAIMTSLMICCGFFVCWTPNEILSFISLTGGSVDFGSWFYHLTISLVFTNSCINPFIYAAKYREFQHGVKRLVSKMRHSRQQSQISYIT